MTEQEDTYRRQEAIATFILSCQSMAHDLRCMCDARRFLSHPRDALLDESAKYIETTIAKEFRRTFGRELFQEALDRHFPAEQ